MNYTGKNDIYFCEYCGHKMLYFYVLNNRLACKGCKTKENNIKEDKQYVR